MCMTRKGNENVKVLKKVENRALGVRVELTQKMTIEGKIIHAVVVTNTDTGYHNRIWVHNTLGYAFKRFKAVTQF